jgi:phage terminase large subunit-like protein
LIPWQREFIYEVFANVDKDGRRLTRRAYLRIARKNGKSELCSAVALYLLTADGEKSPYIYGAAQDRDQASLVFDVAAQMVQQSEQLRNVCKVIHSTKRIVCPETGGYYRAIPADSAGAMGLNAHGIIYDELHTARSRDLYDTLSTSTSAREQPLIFAITTAGFDKNHGPCYEVDNYARGVLAGDIVDESFVGRIYEAPPGTPFEVLAEQDAEGNFVREKDLWTLANPSLIGMPGGFLRPDEMRRAVNEAVHLPRARNHVLNLHFDVWTDQEEAWLDSYSWDECGGVGKIDADFKGRDCYIGLDLSHTQDFTAECVLFPPTDEHGTFDAIWRFWLPEDAILRRGDMAPTLREWEREGLVTVCDGDVVDHRMVEAQVLKDCQQFNMLEIAFDNFHAYPIISNLMEHFPEQLADVGQTYRFMNAPAKELERLVSERRFNHHGNKVMRWMIAHTVVEMNQDDLIRPSRKKSEDKLDGVMALLMAIERVLAAETQAEPQFYSFAD